MPAGALDGLRVLDLTHHIAGPYATKMLADYGADVIKLERPGEGDVARTLGPFPDDDPHPEKSGTFLHLNTNKRGITLNLKTETGRELFVELIRHVDVVVENFAPRVLPALGLSYDRLSEVNPRVVLVSITNFGQTGPYRDYKANELILYSMGGSILGRGGRSPRPPTKYGDHLALRQAGLVGAAATMAALFMREQRGEGEHVDVSIFETQVGSQDSRSPGIIAAQFAGQALARPPAGTIIASGVFPCKDGYVSLTAGGLRFELCVAMMGQPEIFEDPRFATPESRAVPENALAFNQEFLLPWLMQYTMREIWAMAQDVHIFSSPVYNAANLLADTHFQDRGMWVDVDHPVAGTVTMPGRPIIMSATPWQLRRPAPRLGEHNVEVYGEVLGLVAQDVSRLKAFGVV